MDLEPSTSNRTSRYSLYWTAPISLAALLMVACTRMRPCGIYPAFSTAGGHPFGRHLQMAACSATPWNTDGVLLGLLAGTVTAVVLGYFIARVACSTVGRSLSGCHASHSDRCHCTIAGNLVWTGNIFKSTDLCVDRFLPRLVNTVVGVRAVPSHCTT